MISLSSKKSPKAGAFSGFKHKTAPIKELAGHALHLAISPGNLYGILVAKRLDPVFREEIMVAVSTLNACKYCNYAHHDFALQAGVGADELAQLEGIEPENFDEKKFLAITYARELVNKKFGAITPELETELKKFYSREERSDIQTTTRIIMLFSLICNTSDAFLERLKGEPVEGSHPIDELIVASVFFGTILPSVGLYLALLRGESPLKTLKDFRGFASQYQPKVV